MKVGRAQRYAYTLHGFDFQMVARFFSDVEFHFEHFKSQHWHPVNQVRLTRLSSHPVFRSLSCNVLSLLSQRAPLFIPFALRRFTSLRSHLCIILRGL